MDSFLSHNIQKGSNNLRNILMLDVSRRHMTIDDIKTCIDNIDTNVFQQLQLHLNDNEGFALTLSNELKGWLTLSDLNNIIEYAFSHGLKVTIELDIPGHSQSLITLLSTIDSATKWNIDEHTLDFTNAKVKQAIYSIYGTVLSNLDFNVNWCLGIDEVPGNLANYKDLAEIINHLYYLLSKSGNTIYVWNDCMNSKLLSSINGKINIIYWQDSDVNTLDQLKQSVNPIVNATATTNYYNCVDITNTEYINNRLSNQNITSSQLVALWGENSKNTITNTQLADFISKL